MKNKYSSKKLIEKKKKRKKIIFSVTFFIIVLIATGLVFLLNADFWRISNVTISDLKYVEKNQIEEIFYENINANYFLLVNKSNSIFYPKYEIERELLEKYPAIDYINIKRTDLKTINIEIKEYEEYALFCNEKELPEIQDSQIQDPQILTDQDPSQQDFSQNSEPNSYSKENCYLVNRSGNLYSNDFNVEEYSDLIILKGLLENPNIGDTYLESNELKKLIDLNSYLSEIDFNIKEIYSNDSESFEITLKTGLKLLYEKNDNPKQVVENLNLLLTNPSFTEDLNNLEYIDLRFDKNIYYKNKGEESASGQVEVGEAEAESDPATPSTTPDTQNGNENNVDETEGEGESSITNTEENIIEESESN